MDGSFYLYASGREKNIQKKLPSPERWPVRAVGAGHQRWQPPIGRPPEHAAPCMAAWSGGGAGGGGGSGHVVVVVGTMVVAVAGRLELQLMQPTLSCHTVRGRRLGPRPLDI